MNTLSPVAGTCQRNNPTALQTLLWDERRRREEHVQGEAMPDDERILLPLALALARLAARRDAATMIKD